MNGDRGIELARTALPDVILMDINLPGISGFEALKILRAQTRPRRTSRWWPSAPTRCRATSRGGSRPGFFRYLTKPIKVTEFMEALNVALEFADATANNEGTPP